MEIMAFHYTNPPAGVYICRRLRGGSYESNKPPCDEAFKVLVGYTQGRAEEEWAVKFIDLEDFKILLDTYESCSIKHHKNGFRSIWIYDDYVEKE